MTALTKILELNKERYGMTFDKAKATKKLMEEIEEFMIEDSTYEMIDALCDIIVIAAGEISKLGYDPELALSETIKEISSRKQDPLQEIEWKKGLKQDGDKWLKWREQPIESLYFADYDEARL